MFVSPSAFPDSLPTIVFQIIRLLSLLVQAMALRKESIGSRQLAQDGVQGYSLVFW